MKLIFALAILGLVGFATPPALGQSAGGQSGELLDLLLRTSGWVYDWKPSPTSKIDPNTPGETGNGEMVFQMRGDAIVLTIHNLTRSITCERKVTVAEDTVMFDACFSPGVRLRFDPIDSEYPFKGGTTTLDYRLKAK